MNEFLNSRVIWYIMYYLALCIVKYFCGFETTVLWIGAYILVDMQFTNKNQKND